MEPISAIVGFIALFLLMLLLQFSRWLDSIWRTIEPYWMPGLIWGLALALGCFMFLRVRTAIKTWQKFRPEKPTDLDPNLSRGLKIGAVLLLLYCLYEAFAIASTVRMLLGDNPFDLEWHPMEYLPAVIQLVFLIAGAIALLRQRSNAVTFFALAALLHVASLVYGISRNPAYLGHLDMIILYSAIKFGLPLALAIYGLRKGYLVR
jgi:hypothetical protein